MSANQQWPAIGDPSTAPATEPASFADRYLAGVQAQLAQVRDGQLAGVVAAAELIADALASDGWVHTFGTGHGHMLAEELFYRAGGLARVNPILLPDLMLHDGAVASTVAERQPGRAEQILAEHPVAPGDVLIIASNSGGNPVTIELAAQARAQGAHVIALVSRAHAGSTRARAVGPNLMDHADVILDNLGAPGDASIDVSGRALGPTSTAVGAALLQAVVVAAAVLLNQRGLVPEVWTSANASGGDAANEQLVQRYRDRITAL